LESFGTYYNKYELYENFENKEDSKEESKDKKEDSKEESKDSKEDSKEESKNKKEDGKEDSKKESEDGKEDNKKEEKDTLTETDISSLIGIPDADTKGDSNKPADELSAFGAQKQIQTLKTVMEELNQTVEHLAPTLKEGAKVMDMFKQFNLPGLELA